jgi:hypothetical protein
MSLTQVEAQVPLQQVWLAPQLMPPQVHMPFMHLPPGPQELPQVPQLNASLRRLLQPAVLQQVCPVPHWVPDGRQPQLPPWQSWPAVHALPQAPQLLGSAEVSMHFAPQHFPPH